MNSRMRRLTAEYNRIMDEFCGHRHIMVRPLEGNPPVRYLVTYYLKGLKWDKKLKRPVVSFEHQMEIYLHKDYPREKPLCRMKTDIYHPNFGARVCIADHWAAGGNLADIIIQVGQMIQYQNYNPHSPLNLEAARWTLENEHLLPIGSVDLYQADPDVVLNPRDGGGGDHDDIELL